MQERDEKIERFIFPTMESNMYVLVEGKEALVIDPIRIEAAEIYLNSHCVDEVIILLTHEHFDHINGIPWFREHFRTKIVCQRQAIDARRQKIFSSPMVEVVKLLDEGNSKEAKKIEKEFRPFSYEADEIFDDHYEMVWNNHIICLEHAPGHSPGSVIIQLDRKYVFTGDSLIPNLAPTLRWPWSDEKEFYERTMLKLLEIPDEMIIMPGHYEPIEKKKLLYKNGMFVSREDY